MGGAKMQGGANVQDARREMTKTKEQLEEEKKISLSIRIKPLDLDAMDSDQLSNKATELWDTIVRLETEKYDLEERQKRQDYDLKELKERQKQQLRQKAMKKGLDPEALTGKYPPKIRMYSKYERRTDQEHAHHWLGVKSDDHSKVFADPLQDVPCHPKVISHVYALGGTNLELPLRWHHLSICARDSDARIEAGLVVSFHDVSSVHISSTDSTVVWPLGSWETILGPTKGVAVLAQQSVLLFNAKPGMLVLCFLHNLITSFPVVGLSRLLVVLVRLAHHHDVVAAPERILVHLYRVQVRVRVTAFSLIARAPIIVPDREV